MAHLKTTELNLCSQEPFLPFEDIIVLCRKTPDDTHSVLHFVLQDYRATIDLFCYKISRAI